MKTSFLLSSALGILLLSGTANADVIKYVATLNGDQEVPQSTTTATGTATLEYDTTTKQLSGTISYEGLSGDATAAHIHEALCGVNNPSGSFDFGNELASPITFPASPDSELSEDELKSLEAGKFYINIHTAANAGGEIRGQLYKEGSTDKCPADKTADAGTLGTDGGSNGTSSGGNTNDAGTGKSSSGSATPASTDDSSGCSTTGTGSAPGSGLAIALGVGVAVAAMSRGRRKR